MRVGIDYTAAVTQGAGIGRYTRELVRAIVAQGHEHSYRLFFASYGTPASSPYLAGLRQLCEAHPNVSAHPIPLPPRRLAQLWHRLRLPLPVEVFTGRLDLLHAPDFVPPPTRARRTIVTIHDLSYLVHPECALPSVARYLRDAVPRGIARADAILADSQATRRDLLNHMRVAPERVTVVYPGVGPQFRPLPAAEIEPERRRMGLPERFLLFISTIEPRKNLVRLLEAFARLTSGGGASSPAARDLHLVIGGRRGWMYEPVFEAIERLGLRERVRVLDYVDDKDLPTLYNLAWAFAYPSIYEGFGIPALEAMACGTPVLTADNSSLPEVVGGAAVLVRADDVGSIVDGLIQIVEDEPLRERLRAEGPAQARPFTWERAASQVLDLYGALAR